MSTIPVRYLVQLDPANVSGESRVFNCLNGIMSDGSGVTTETRDIPVGTVIGSVSTVHDPEAEVSAESLLTLYVVTDGPLNRIDEQPTVGDVVVSTCPTNDIFFQAGAALVVTGQGGQTASLNVGTVLNIINTVMPQPTPPAEPVTETPMGDYIWDGATGTLLSVDTSNDNVYVTVPDPSTIIGSELIVNHRVDGMTGNAVTIGLSAATGHQSDLTVALNSTVTIRAITGSYVVTSIA